MKRKHYKPSMLVLNALAAAMTGIFVILSAVEDNGYYLIPAGVFYVLWCIAYVKAYKTLSIR